VPDAIANRFGSGVGRAFAPEPALFERVPGGLFRPTGEVDQTATGRKS